MGNAGILNVIAAGNDTEYRNDSSLSGKLYESKRFIGSGFDLDRLTKRVSKIRCASV